MYKALILIAVSLIGLSCSVRRCQPSKHSSDYASIKQQDKIYH